MLNEKGKASTVVVGIIVVAAFIVAAALVYTSGPEKEAAPEAISKRVKIDLKDKTAGAPVSAQGQPVISPPKAAASAQPPKDSGKQASKEPVKPLVAAAKTPEPAVKREPVKAVAPPKVEPATIAPASKPSAVKRAVVSKPKATPVKQWAVNLASFITDREAQEFKRSLKKAGHRAYVTSFKKDDITWYRVRAGFYKTEEDAKKSGKLIAEKFKLENEPWITKPTKAEISKFSR